MSSPGDHITTTVMSQWLWRHPYHIADVKFYEKYIIC